LSNCYNFQGGRQIFCARLATAAYATVCASTSDASTWLHV
jgi:hypothetical protein